MISVRLSFKIDYNRQLMVCNCLCRSEKTSEVGTKCPRRYSRLKWRSLLVEKEKPYKIISKRTSSLIKSLIKVRWIFQLFSSPKAKVSSTKLHWINCSWSQSSKIHWWLLKVDNMVSKILIYTVQIAILQYKNCALYSMENQELLGIKNHWAMQDRWSFHLSKADSQILKTNLLSAKWRQSEAMNFHAISAYQPRNPRPRHYS